MSETNDWITISDKVKRRPKKTKNLKGTPNGNGNSTESSSSSSSASNYDEGEATVILRRRPVATGGKADRSALRQGKFQTVAREKSEKIDRHHLAKLDNDHETLEASKLDRSWIQRVQKARQQRGLSQKDLALKLNLDVGIINQYEKGTVLVPDGKVVDKINKFLFQKYG